MPRETMLEHPDASPHMESAKIGVSEMDAVSEVDWMRLATVLLHGKRTILRFVLVIVALTAIVVFALMKPMYTAEAVFLPPQTSPGSSMAQLANQLGSLGVMGALSGMKTSGEVYLGILESRTIADDIIRQFDLQKVYNLKRHSDTVKRLGKLSTFTSGKTTLITISVEDHDPGRAAGLANAYLDELRNLNGRLALTEASQRRLFFQEQLEHEKDALADAEVALTKTEQQTGLIVPTGQAQVEIESMAQVRAQITNLESHLAALRQGATNENPDVVRLQTQIAGLQEQLRKRENAPGKPQPGNVQPPTSKIPELAQEYVRKQREVKYHEALFEMIAKQYEAARLDEAREAPVLQVVDRAVVPDKKSGPSRLLALIGATLFGAFLGVLWVLMKNGLSTMKDNPVTAAKIEALRDAATKR